MWCFLLHYLHSMRKAHAAVSEHEAGQALPQLEAAHSQLAGLGGALWLDQASLSHQSRRKRDPRFGRQEHV